MNQSDRNDWYYILEGRIPVRAPSMLEGAEWLSDNLDARIVARTTVGESEVSTVFLGIDHNWEDGPPLLFETLVFDGPMAGVMERCSTWVEAEDMHHRMVERAELFPE